MRFLNNYFSLDTLKTTVGAEITAGITTFLTMAYIIAVNPAILSATGMDKGSLFVATVIISAISSLCMGLYAKWPVALAPGMGLNAFFTYAVVLSMGLTWQVALFAVFVSGIIFLFISVTSLRRIIIQSIPKNLKIGIGVGVGFFLAYIGLQNAGIIVANNATITGFGSLKETTVLLSCFGFLLILFLESLKVRGSLLMSILIITIVSFIVTDNSYKGVIGIIPSFSTFMALDFNMSLLLNIPFITVVLSILFVDFFDSTGTLLAISHSVNHEDDNVALDIEKNSKPLIVDSIATIVGSVLGTSTATAYIESLAGIKQGGKSGLTACVVGILFLLSLFFFPLIDSIPSYATAPALIYVGFLFIQNLKELDFNDIFELIPAGIAAFMMPFTFSISHGIIFGFISYIAIQLGRGEYKKITPMVWIVAIIGIVYLYNN